MIFIIAKETFKTGGKLFQKVIIVKSKLEHKCLFLNVLNYFKSSYIVHNKVSLGTIFQFTFDITFRNGFENHSPKFYDSSYF